MSSDGRRLLSALVSGQNLKAFADMQLSSALFKGSEVAMFEFVKGHVAKYGKIPNPETMADNEHIVGLVVETHEPPEFYMESVEKRYLHSQLKEVVLQAQELLKDEESEQAFEALTERISSLLQKKNRSHLFDFRDAAKLIAAELKMQQSDTGDYFMKFGWPTLDTMTGGVRAGDMISFIGRPAAGKTFKLLYMAHNNWLKGHVPLFVSMEMTAQVIMQRLTAMDVKYPLTDLMKGTVSSPSFSKIMKKMAENKAKENGLWVVDGNLTTNVDDIVMQCRQLKPSGVFADGAYLIRHKNPKMSKWDRMSENAELLKQQVATDLGIPVVCSYQMSRDSKKKKKDEKHGVEDIYGTDAIGQLSTVVLGLFEEDSVETLARRRVDVLKGRNGEVGSFPINWDFQKMNFSEVLKEDVEDLQFLG